MKKPNSQMQELLDVHAEMGPLAIETVSAEHARHIPLLDKAAIGVYGKHLGKKAFAVLPMPVGKIQHKVIPGEEGVEILTRIYTPKGDAPEGGWPTVVYFHGGGWVIANLDTYDASCRALCEGSKSIVVSVHYRQAPEHKWPAAPSDCYMAYKWVCENAATIDACANKIAIAGESAGGNLALVTCLYLREKGLKAPAHMLLVYPVTDIAKGEQSPSAIECSDAKPLNTPMLGWFYNHYLPENADRKNPFISPIYADMSNLPSCTVILAEIDPLRSDGEALADKLVHSGNNVQSRIYEGVCHEFFGCAGLVDEATKAMKYACDRIKDAFKHEETMMEIHRRSA